MDLFRATAEEGAHIVAQLGAAYYGVVTEHHSLAVEDGAVGDELHLGDEVAARLVAGGERAGPCGGVFQHRALVGDAAPLGVTKGVAHAGVGMPHTQSASVGSFSPIVLPPASRMASVLMPR